MCSIGHFSCARNLPLSFISHHWIFRVLYRRLWLATARPDDASGDLLSHNESIEIGMNESLCCFVITSMVVYTFLRTSPTTDLWVWIKVLFWKNVWEICTFYWWITIVIVFRNDDRNHFSTAGLEMVVPARVGDAPYPCDTHEIGNSSNRHWGKSCFIAEKCPRGDLSSLGYTTVLVGTVKANFDFWMDHINKFLKGSPCRQV